jgi:hypothetical protein
MVTPLPDAGRALDAAVVRTAFAPLYLLEAGKLRGGCFAWSARDNAVACVEFAWSARGEGSIAVRVHGDTPTSFQVFAGPDGATVKDMDQLTQSAGFHRDALEQAKAHLNAHGFDAFPSGLARAALDPGAPHTLEGTAFTLTHARTESAPGADGTPPRFTTSVSLQCSGRAVVLDVPASFVRPLGAVSLEAIALPNGALLLTGASDWVDTDNRGESFEAVTGTVNAWCTPSRDAGGDQ